MHRVRMVLTQISSIEPRGSVIVFLLAKVEPPLRLSIVRIVPDLYVWRAAPAARLAGSFPKNSQKDGGPYPPWPDPLFTLSREMYPGIQLDRFDAIPNR